jgi:predicted nucleotide-binding protein
MTKPSSGVRALRRIHGKLDLIEEDSSIGPEPAQPAGTARRFGSKVFLVHGQNQGLREEVARALEKLGLEIVILHEQSNQGRTVIEKFEGNAANVGFAVIIASADDHGGPISSNDLRPRARQNVVFEAGFFFGALGRDRTAILYEENVELPTDITGIVYIPISGGWQLLLARELRTAGFTVDLNKL